MSAHAAAAGSHGPCGLDAFAFRSPEDGSRSFRPLVEFNARFTAGTVALGHIARHLGRVKTALGLSSDEICYFYIGSGAGAGSGAPKAGNTVVPLLGESHDRTRGPVLFVAREQAAVDEWLGPKASE